MPEFAVLEPAIDPNNRITFLLDWELTMKCNLDCSYCPSGLYSGHDNSTSHPPLDECLESIDFMLKYADLYMQRRPKGLKHVVLNVYGGEALHHPNIVEILEQVHKRSKKYKDRWHLTVTTTTNAIVSSTRMAGIIPLIDEFTVSYHSENNTKQKQQFKDNLLAIKQSAARLKCVVLMNTDTEYFADGQAMIEWLTENNIKMLPRQLDMDFGSTKQYDEKQIVWFNNLYQEKTYGASDNINTAKSANLSDVGRACCGGRQTCQDQDYKNRKFYVMDNKFTGWSCSVNWFFVYVKQVTQEVFVNKDCKMNFDGTVGPIGSLTNTAEILNTLANQLDTGTLPVIQCNKSHCLCGLCAPKAKTLETYNTIIKKYQENYEISTTNLLH
jgi:organic radical activating enzyme